MLVVDTVLVDVILVLLSYRDVATVGSAEATFLFCELSTIAHIMG